MTEKPLEIADFKKVAINRITNYVVYFTYEGKKYFIKVCNGLYDDDEGGEENVLLLFSKENNVVHFMSRSNDFDSDLYNLTGKIKKGTPYSKLLEYGYIETFVSNCIKKDLFILM
jgi:hypothetical protein